MSFMKIVFPRKAASKHFEQGADMFGGGELERCGIKVDVARFATFFGFPGSFQLFPKWHMPKEFCICCSCLSGSTIRKG